MSTTAPTTTERLVTAEEFMRMSFDRPVELVRGVIVEVGAREDAMPERVHGVICLRIGAALLNWAMSRKAGTPATNDSFVRTGFEPDTLRGADVLFFSTEKVEEGALTPERIDIPPDLCVEVLSPSNRWSEISEKLDEYLRCGVSEVWIVDPELESVQVYRPGSHRIVRGGERLTSESLPGFEADVSKFFDLT